MSKESSTSTSHVSTPNQVTNISTSEAHDANVNGQSTPSNAPGNIWIFLVDKFWILYPVYLLKYVV